MIPRKLYQFEAAHAQLFVILFAHLLPGLSSLPQSGVQLPKFGHVPTNRVLPVDHLTAADYEDKQEADSDNHDDGGPVSNRDREYCSRWMKLEFANALKSSERKGRQEEGETDSLLANYLEYDPVTVVGPLLNIMGNAFSANATERNVTYINENYKKLPPFFKSQVTDFIQVFKALLTTVQP